MIGTLSVICGPMFSCKTEELIRRLRRAEISKAGVICFKPEIDIRYGKDNTISSHAKSSFWSIPVKDSQDLFDKYSKAENISVIGIDEVQFFDEKIIETILKLMNLGVNVIVSGLDLDYKNVPFQITANLLAYAENIDKFTAICAKCHGDATKTFKKDTTNEDRIAVGGLDMYEPRCATCHQTFP